MRIATLLTTAALLAASYPVAASSPPAPLLDARGCYATLHVLTDDPKRLQPRFVPDHYTLLTWAPGVPYIALWSLACDSARVGGGSARPTQLSIAAVPVAHPERQGTEQPPLELPNTWSHYTHLVLTDNRELARRLDEQALPVRYVSNMAFEREVYLGDGLEPLRPVAETSVAVPGAWESWTRPLLQHEPAHSHSNEFWFDAPGGATVLHVRIRSASDHFCEVSTGDQCGTVTAAPGSPFGDLLGGTRRSADAAVDHEKITRVVAFGSRR